MLISECVRNAADAMACWLSRVDEEDAGGRPAFKLTYEETAAVLSCIRDAEANCDDALTELAARLKIQIQWLAKVIEDNQIADGAFTAEEWIARAEKFAEQERQ